MIGPGGWLYFQRGVFHVTSIETPWNAPFRHKSTGLYRWHPLTDRTEYHFNVGPNPHGDVFDRWGNQFVSDGTSGTGYHVAFPGRKSPQQLYVKQYRPVPGTGLVSGSHFPEELRGNLLIANAIGFQGVAQYKFVDQGAGFHCEPVEVLMKSSDPNFRPTAVRIGGDGALYITDWQNPLIGHLQHNLRDPNRDHRHGRIYRVTVDGRALRKPVKMVGKPIDEVIRHMTSPDDDIRYRARLELTGRDHQQVAAAAARFAVGFDAGDPAAAQPLLEALWLHQQHQLVNEPLLRKVLASPDGEARAAATRVLREWHDRIEGVGPLLVKLAGDPHPRVRAEAVISAVYYNGPESAEVIFRVEQSPKQTHLEWVLSEARKSINIDQILKETLAAGRPLSKAAQLYMLRSASADELVKLEPTEAVYLAILSRTIASAKQLDYAVSGLAKLRNTSELKLLVELIGDQDARGQSSGLAGAAELLLAQPLDALQSILPQLQQFAGQGKTPAARRLGYAGWMLAEGDGNEAFASAGADADRLRDLLAAVPLVQDDVVRGKLFGLVQSLAADPPDAAQDAGPTAGSQPGLLVDYFLPSPSNVARETLEKRRPTASGVAADVSLNVKEITNRDGFALRFTGSIQIPQSGRYTFYLTSDDGSRLYIGGEEAINNDGLHGPVEKSGAVELSAGAHPILVTYFDNGGGDGLSLAWAGAGVKRKQVVPGEHFSTGAGRTLRDDAAAALAEIPGHDAEKFRTLAALVRDGQARTTAIGVLRGVDRRHWPPREVRPLVDSLVAYVSQIPARYRTGPAAADAVALTRSLSTALPPEQARAVAARLENLDVRVIAIGTVPHRMIYDQTRIVVAAGKPVELRFSNADAMPHNLAITLPGAMAEVGELAEATAQTPDVMARQYIPKSDKILHASRLLQPGDSQAISFEAPKTPGVYPIVCTYPGHWRRMHAAMYVVEDLDAYHADPIEFLAAREPQIKDDMLKLLGKSKQWKLDDLLADVQPLAHGRAYPVGLNAFKVGNCIACHKIGDDGQNIGPDLAKLEPMKQHPEHILRSLINPSEKIDEKYQSYSFVLVSGKIVSGMVLEETPQQVKLIENTLAKTRPLTIRKADIEERRKSPKSLMPEGLLDKLTREEILDLIAFIHAGGNPKAKIFAGHEGHEH